MVVALAAPALAGCGGFGFGDKSAPAASAPPVPPMATTQAAPTQLAPTQAAPMQVAPTAPVQTSALPAPAAAGASPPASAPAAVSQGPVAPPPPTVPTGAALGAVLGGPVGASLTDSDREAAWTAQVAALDSGKPRSWRGANHVYGSVEPGLETGGGCRAYTQTIYVAGRPNRGQGVACRQAEGGWKATS